MVFVLCFFLKEYGKKQVKEMCKQMSPLFLGVCVCVCACVCMHMYELYINTRGPAHD